MPFSVIILAAGRGQRMHSTLPKMLHPVGGTPMLEHVILSAKALNPQSVVVVYGHQGELLKKALMHHEDLVWAEQTETKGTGHAVLQALPCVQNVEKVLILCGDAPLVQTETLAEFIELSTLQFADIGLVTANVYPPTGFGRILRDASGKILRIVEEKETTLAEKNITEINTGIFWASRQKLENWLPRLRTENVQQEYYLTDIVSLALEEKLPVTTHLAESSLEILGVNDKQQLALVERFYQNRQAANLMRQGVTLLDPNRFDLRGTLTAGRDVVIDINVILQGKVILEDGVKIGPHVIIKDALIQKGAEILANSIVESAIIGPNATVGPFARIRPGTELKENVKIGNFVELKNAKVDTGSKINHLSYIGDAIIGKEVNIGAGTITCNYDGKNKHQTLIGDNSFIGSDTQLIAPVTVGENVTIGAGTTIVKDVPSHHLIHNQIQHRSVVKDVSKHLSKEE